MTLGQRSCDATLAKNSTFQMPDQGVVKSRRRRAPVDAPPPNAQCSVAPVPSQRCTEMVAILEQLHFPKRTNTISKRFGSSYTLGDTRAVPGSTGFSEEGLNHAIVSKSHPVAQKTLLLELWDVLKQEGEALLLR